MNRNAPRVIVESSETDDANPLTGAQSMAAARLGLPLAVYLMLGEDARVRSVLTPHNRAAQPLPARRASCDLVVLQACQRVEGRSCVQAFPDLASRG